ncbi:MAG: peptide deformylase [Oscillospiraceae bacterium]
MICEIIKDEDFLRQPSTPATAKDLSLAQDLLDTLSANADRCVGLAANMIGVSKRIIVVDDEGTPLVLINPEIIKSSEPFQAEEACLSLTGTRPTKRYKSIKVQYQNTNLQTRLKSFKGFTAQIIQHEIDHCNGIII